MSDDNGKKEIPGELDLSELSSLSLEPSWASGDKAKKISVERFSRDDRRGNTNRREFSRDGNAKQSPRDRRPPRRDAASRDGNAFSDAPRRERPAFAEKPRATDAGAPQRRRERDGDFRRREKFGSPFRRDRAGVPNFAPRLVDVSFFPEDKPFSVLAKAIKTSARTYGLFEITRLILEKPERFVVSVKPLERKADPAKTAPAETPRPAPTSFFVSVPDGMPFLNESDAISYVFDRYAEKFFTIETVETEPPKGNFTMVSKCGFTGKLLAPPNYHAYQQILRDFHAANFPAMPFEKFMARLETVKDQESIDAWIAAMKTVTRYTVKDRREGEPETLDGAGAAKAFLVANRKEKLVRTTSAARIPGKLLEQMPNGPLKSAIENELSFQRKKPLNTANALRGRLRRSGFTLFKHGGKGITFLCAIRRKFRTPDSVFSDTIQRIFDFLEKHPETKIQDLPQKMLGIESPATQTGTPAPTESAAETVPANEEPAAATTENEAAPAMESAPETETPSVPAAETDKETEAQISALFGAVRWLVLEGYVSELSDGALFTYPKMTAAQAKIIAAKDAQNEHADDKNTPEQPDDIAAGIPPAPEGVPAEIAPETAPAPEETPAESAPESSPAE